MVTQWPLVSNWRPLRLSVEISCSCDYSVNSPDDSDLLGIWRQRQKVIRDIVFPNTLLTCCSSEVCDTADYEVIRFAQQKNVWHIETMRIIPQHVKFRCCSTISVWQTGYDSRFSILKARRDFGYYHIAIHDMRKATLYFFPPPHLESMLVSKAISKKGHRHKANFHIIGNTVPRINRQYGTNSAPLP